MKAAQTFAPVTVTLETAEELLDMIYLLQEASARIDSKSTQNILQQRARSLAFEIYDQLEGMK